MLADFIRQRGFDIVVQEVTSTEVLNVPDYDSRINGVSVRGTAILAWGTLHLTNIINLPSRLAITAD
jgi:hypothetical protein